MKYRLYANRVEDNAPIFREKMTLSLSKKDAACPNYLALPSSERLPPDPLLLQCCPADVDEVVTVSDAVFEESLDDKGPDMMTRHRSMSKRALLLEAQSPQHLVSHHPHNPYCETCILAHLKQSRMHRKTPAADDELPATTDTGQKLSADHIIVARDANPNDPKAAFTGETYAFSVRDRFSGMALVFPQTKKNKEETYKALKFFQGLSDAFVQISW